METGTKGTTRVVIDPHWRDRIREGQEDRGIDVLRAKIEASGIFNYVGYEVMLYYLWGIDEEIRLILILKQCYERLGHIGIAMTHDLIG